ncbi:MAG TPA: hypothetical protein VG871_07140 [Vicinamibacterales bacterium]|nr:hypothetical protein [Vicinamibacterales bacterium]
MWRSLGAIACLLALASPARAQTPQPFPRPGGEPAQPARTAPPPQAPPAAAPQAAPAARPAPAQTTSGAPDAATLGLPVYPTAQFLASYDAGRGQRYYIFGTLAPYSDLVSYYRSQLKEKGDEVFDQPPTYMFQIGKFRDETMAFPPGVTIKDWTWGGSKGYLNPKAGAQPERFPSIIMIVPPPPAAQR